jgi:cytochrome c peroxidase
MTYWHLRSWSKRVAASSTLVALAITAAFAARLTAIDDEAGARLIDPGKHTFERETFGGNGRTCLTCHSRGTGTLSPAEAQTRFARDANDPLFRGDGSDDGAGQGVQRMLTDATLLVRVPFADNVSLAETRRPLSIGAAL